MNVIAIREVPYDGLNLKFLNLIHKEGNLYRASEKFEMRRVIKYGTNRGGYNRGGYKEHLKWESTDTPYEDIMFATTADDIINAEQDEKLSSSFKKFKIYKEPILLVYDISGFEKIADRQWKFIDPKNKKKYLREIIILGKPKKV